MTIDAEIFMQIADSLRQDLPDQWVKAWLQVELEDHSGRTACFYQSKSESNSHHVDIQADLITLFRQLHKSMMRRQSEAWNSATYILYSDGHFDIYFDYHDFSASNSLDRRKAWREKYLCH